MSLQARYKFYTKLYKKYSPDLSDEEIGYEVRNLSHAENQQESIDNFYKNVVGKPVTTKQRIRISEFVDPTGVEGVVNSANKNIEEENKKILAANAKKRAEYEKELKELQESKDADLTEKFNFQMDELTSGVFVDGEARDKYKDQMDAAEKIEDKDLRDEAKLKAWQDIKSVKL